MEVLPHVYWGVLVKKLPNGADDPLFLREFAAYIQGQTKKNEPDNFVSNIKQWYQIHWAILNLPDSERVIEGKRGRKNLYKYADKFLEMHTVCFTFFFLFFFFFLILTGSAQHVDCWH